jgi:hypothetical protein
MAVSDFGFVEESVEGLHTLMILLGGVCRNGRQGFG